MNQDTSNTIYTIYRGSRIFSPIAKYVGLPLDQFNCVFTEILALIFAICFRRYLPPKPNNLLKRHLVSKSFSTEYYSTYLF